MKFRILLLSTLFHSAEDKYYSLSGSLNVINVLDTKLSLVSLLARLSMK